MDEVYGWSSRSSTYFERIKKSLTNRVLTRVIDVSLSRNDLKNYSLPTWKSGLGNYHCTIVSRLILVKSTLSIGMSLY